MNAPESEKLLSSKVAGKCNQIHGEKEEEEKNVYTAQGDTFICFTSM